MKTWSVGIGIVGTVRIRVCADTAAEASKEARRIVNSDDLIIDALEPALGGFGTSERACLEWEAVVGEPGVDARLIGGDK